MNDTCLKRLKDMGAEVDCTLERLMGNKEIYLKFLLDFPQNKNILKLRNAVEEQDGIQAETEVHTLKGVALNLGLSSLVQVCTKMITLLREGKDEDAFAMMDEVEECFYTWVDAIHA